MINLTVQTRGRGYSLIWAKQVCVINMVWFSGSCVLCLQVMQFHWLECLVVLRTKSPQQMSGLQKIATISFQKIISMVLV